MLDHVPVRRGELYAEIQPPAPWLAQGPGGVHYRIRRIGIGVSTLVEQSKLTSASAKTQDKETTLSLAPTATGQFQLLVEESHRPKPR